MSDPTTRITKLQAEEMLPAAQLVVKKLERKFCAAMKAAEWNRASRISDKLSTAEAHLEYLEFVIRDDH